MNKESEKQKWNDIFLEDCAVYDKKIAEEYTTLQERITELEKENTELKEQISTKDILIKELQEQKVYWKESSFDWRHKFFKSDKVKRLVKKDKQLTNAKDIIKKFLEFVNNEVEYDPEHPQEHTDLWNELCAEAEQFIKDSGVEK